MGEIGCPLLTSKGFGKTDTGIRFNRGNLRLIITNEEIIKFCNQCPSPECVLEGSKGKPFSVYVAVYVKPSEVVYQCQQCKTVETLTFRNGKMDNTQKFIQKGDKIYHMVNCGECKQVGTTL